MAAVAMSRAMRSASLSSAVRIPVIPSVRNASILARSPVSPRLATSVLAKQTVVAAPRFGVRSMSGMPTWLTVGNIRKYAPQIGMVGGALVVVYGLSKMMLYVTTSLLELDMYQVFNYGLFTGLIGTAVFGVGAAYVYRHVSINARVALNRALAKVQRSAVAKASLGENIRIGPLRSYYTHNGHVAVGSKGFAWVEPRALLLFQVAGEKGQAMVSGEAVKHKGKYVFNALALDTLERPGSKPELIVLSGDVDKMKRVGMLRGFLQVERAAFVPQNKVEDDEARVREQEALPETEEGEEGAAAAAADASKAPLR